MWRGEQSEYALVLEIRGDGTAGDFYFTYNSMDTDVPAFEDSTFNFEPVLCGQGPFTVGKVKGSLGLGLLGCLASVYWNWWFWSTRGQASLPLPYDFDPDEIIQLDILSTSRPEFVMTGIRESDKGEREIVGLYDTK